VNFSEPFIRRPVMTAVLTVSVILFGVLSYLQLPVNDLPAVDYPVIQVQADYPGASPDTVANNIATPLERQFMQINGLELVTSKSTQGHTSLTLQFALSKSLDAAATDVQTAISQATGSLPVDLPSPPTFSKTNPNDQPILYIALTSDSVTPGQLYDYGSTQVGQRISILPGVSRVNVFGTKSAIRIKADPSAMWARGISVDDLAAAIENGTSYTGAGEFDSAAGTALLRPRGQLEGAQAYSDLIVGSRDGAPVYLRDVARFDFNYSISSYPRTVSSIIAEAIPWTVGLLGTTTVLSFTIGTLLGALLAWPGAPCWMRLLMPPLWALHAIPFFLLGLILMYLLAFRAQLLPMFGGYTAGAFPGLTLAFVGDVIAHSILPALSIVLVATGGWALGMRGMMVTTQGEDYVTFAEAKGLRRLTIFLRYCVRNAILPQTTALALALGNILSGAVLVEVIFGYPGVGTILFHAIRENDHFLIQGIVFTVIVALGVATLILDVLYPLLDPRISYRRT